METDKYTSRGKLNKTITICCPKHGFKQTYDLGRKGKCVAVGCSSCFKDLREKILEYENKG